jgi:hypothetical protein
MVQPQKFGRALGIGVRVASNLLRERAAGQATGHSGSAPPASEPAQSESFSSEARLESAARVIENVEKLAGKDRQAAIAERSRGVGHGARRFGQAVWGPFMHAGSVLWLEITGSFFALFALFFAQNIYRVRQSWRQGPGHAHFLLYCALTLIFLWFSSSSFLRAHRKNKRPH